jgi:hypothetical protein
MRAFVLEPWLLPNLPNRGPGLSVRGKDPNDPEVVMSIRVPKCMRRKKNVHTAATIQNLTGLPRLLVSMKGASLAD